MDHPGGATSHCHYEEASPSSDLIREPAVYNCSGSGVFYSAELERTLEKSKETSEELSQNFQGEVFRKVFRKVSKNSRGHPGLPGVVGACGALGNPGPPGLSGGPGVFGDVISPGRQKRKWKYLRKLLWMCVSILFTHVHLGAAQILGDRTDSWNPERKPFRKDLVDPGDGYLLARGNFTSHFTLSIATTASYMCDLNFFTGNVSHFCNIYKDAGNHCPQTGWSVSVKAEGNRTSEFELSVEFLNVERGFDYCIYLQAPDNYIIYSGSVNVSGTAMQTQSSPGTTTAAKSGSTTAVAPTATTRDPACDAPNSAPQHNIWMWFFITSLMVNFLLVLGIVLKNRFLTCYDRLRRCFRESNSGNAVPTVDPDQEASAQGDAKSLTDSGTGLNTRDGSLADVTLDANTTVTTEIEGP